MECLSQFVLRFQEFVFGCSARASPNKRIKALTLADYFRRFPLYGSLITLKHFNFNFFLFSFQEVCYIVLSIKHN